MAFLLLLIFVFNTYALPLLLPVDIADRKISALMKLTPIGNFGAARKARTTIPAHLHTGIDIKRPHPNYIDEPIFPVATGKVISIRKDNAFAQIIIEHNIQRQPFWTLYEHIAGILVKAGAVVDPSRPIARYLNKEELNRFGWQFDHFHFEILRVKPIALPHDHNLPERKFNAYTLSCFTENDLNKYYYNPIAFFNEKK